MKLRTSSFTSVLLALLVLSVFSSLTLLTAKAEGNNTLTVQLLSITDGQASMTNQNTHASSSAAKLVIPINASQGSGCAALYAYNKPLSTLQFFMVYTSYVNALPRLIIQLDTNHDKVADLVLLSDYQFVGKGDWQLIQGGQRWGWTEATTSLGLYGQVWQDFYYWKGVYGEATVLSVGVALEYWAVKDSNGLGQPLYADEVLINGVTYNIAEPDEAPDDWPMFRHDSQRTGAANSPLVNGNLSWQYSTGDKIRSSAAVVDGVVYTGSNNGWVYTLNATSGALLWRYYSGSQIESSPAVVDNVVYLGVLWDGHNGYVCALNATTGALLWRFATNSGVESSPTIVNGIVYIGSYYGFIYALNASNGAQIWSYLTGSFVFSSPAFSNGVIYIGSGDGGVYALNATSGSRLWVFHTGGAIYASPAVNAGIVYIGSNDDNVYALNASNGALIWRYTTGGYVESSAAVANGAIYITSSDGKMYALSAANGSKLWSFRSPYTNSSGHVYSSPAVAGSTVYVGSNDGYIFALRADDGSVIWAWRSGGYIFASPVIAKGMLYVGSFDGNIYALGTAQASPAVNSQMVTNTYAQTSTARLSATSESTANPTSSAIQQTVSAPQIQSPMQVTQSETEQQNIQPINGTEDFSIPILIGIVAILATALSVGAIKIGKIMG